MVNISKYNGEINELFDIWLNVFKNIPFTEDLDKDTFQTSFLENAMAENICYLARQDSSLKGAALIHIYPGWGAVLQLWVPHSELGDEISIQLLNKSIELCKERKIPTLSPKPLLGSPKYYEFFLNHNFIVNEDYPEGLWMESKLDEIPEYVIPEELKITFTDDLDESGDIEELARFEIIIAQGQLDLDTEFDKNVQALRDEMKEENVMYGIAKINSKIVGYSRTIFANLLSEENIVKNRGLAVLEDYRNKSIGKVLLISSMNMVRDKGYNKMYISTHSKNPARHLYERVGFVTIETVPTLVYKIV